MTKVSIINTLEIIPLRNSNIMKSGPNRNITEIHVIQLKEIFKILTKLSGAPVDQVYKLMDEVDARVQCKDSLIKAKEEIVADKVHMKSFGQNSPFVSLLVTKFSSSEPIFRQMRESLAKGNDDIDDLIRTLLLTFKPNSGLLEEAKLIAAIIHSTGERQILLFNRLKRHHLYGISILSTYCSQEYVDHLIAQDFVIIKQLVENIRLATGDAQILLFRDLKTKYADGLILL